MIRASWNFKSFFFLVPRLRHADVRDFDDRLSLVPTVVAPRPVVESSESLMPPLVVSVSTMSDQLGFFLFGKRAACAEDMMTGEGGRSSNQGRCNQLCQPKKSNA